MPPVAHASSLETLRAEYNERREQAIARFSTERKPVRLTSSLCSATDQLVRGIWQSAGLPEGWALLAVGGYGRGELFPHSDIDLLILIDSVPDTAATAALEKFVSLLWDSALAIGHSVRTLEECRRELIADVTVQTALMERRWLAGNQTIHTHLESVVAEGLTSYEYFKAKVQEMRQRHRKYENTPYSLEPNTKESPGGLRDLQTITWISKRAGLGTNWAQMQQTGLITGAEQQLLEHNERLMRRIRATLHISAERGEDRLIFDLQNSVASYLGYTDRPGRRASEQLMQRYYRAAKTVTQLSSILTQNIDERLGQATEVVAQTLDHEFHSRNRLLEPVDPELFAKDPSAILRAFLVLQQHPSLRGMTTSALRTMWNARTQIDATFRRDRSNRLLFMQLIQAPVGVTHALRWMNQWSILGHYLPVFRRIVGRMQHDLFHVYTVDQHIMMVVRNLRRFAIVEHAHEYPLCSQLMATMDKPWRLYLAALFHDIAKGRGGDHSTLGAVDVREFCAAHFVDKEDTDLIAFLVEHHLTLSTVAQKQDISDPSVVESFAQIVQNEDRLIALYLLTVADVRGTSPKVWNNWKAKLLEELFRNTRHFLSGEMPKPTDRMGARRREALRILQLQAISPDDYQDFWDSLEISYFLRTDADEIAWHTRVLSHHHHSKEPIVKTRMSPWGEGFQVAIYTPDQPDLFGRICAYFAGAGLSVLDAKIHTTDAGYALDSFLVVDPFNDANAPEQYRNKLSLVEVELAHALGTDKPIPAVTDGRGSRRSRSFPVQPTVEFRPDEHQEKFVLSIVANDRPGLLYQIAQVLADHEIAVHAARVMTLGERVEDSFLVDGASLLNNRTQLEIENKLLRALEQPD